ncbi:RES family NAD+ phosphorylase [Sphingomonas sp.]|uniref:RES family NAD+ phosphorylase n=1 Tax=Sphingomonas sp. TaxID=28214 RepID=UPI0025DB6727|nr:RES family NAD+ phosphorylase [Sphingomonas sp.]
MSQSLWRIGTDTHGYSASDLSGTGARLSGGRWNDIGIGVVYTSCTRSLACLETVVHLGAEELPLNRYLIEIAVPDDIWATAEHLDHLTAPVGWDAHPAGIESTNFGSAWTISQRTVLLFVPSTIVLEESNVLINPAHPDAARITAKKMRKWIYDHRL